MIRDIILKNRSYRCFNEFFTINSNTLRSFIDSARISGASANLQNLKFIVANTTEKNNLIFPNLAWAGYLKDWKGPAKGERPSAYIIILSDNEIHESPFQVDVGIAAQSILLSAAEKDLGGCMVGSIQRTKLREALVIPDRYDIMLVIALGKPAESIVLEEVKDGNIKYWRDESGTHHVPKRSLDELILEL